MPNQSQCLHLTSYYPIFRDGARQTEIFLCRYRHKHHICIDGERERKKERKNHEKNMKERIMKERIMKERIMKM